ncbi:lipase family protein [Streptomyces sp. WELS2]|uniref:lipase family protein n=1 Tax=Streptomyces sp. WELS2 TaxID=2749435 RepID=UPI0015F0B480|nr:hypothetical protein [Streptomyces sp. WELS2]
MAVPARFDHASTGYSLQRAYWLARAAEPAYKEEAYPAADGVYTHGRPRTGDRLPAEALHQGFGGRMDRFVDNNDIVPQLPPEPVYTHVRALRSFDPKGRPHESVPMLSALGDRARGLIADLFAPVSDGVRDHLMRRCLAALEHHPA